MNLTLPFSVILLHFLADWPLQSSWMAVNKSKHWDPLTLHVLVYTLVFCFAGFNWAFLAVTFGAHWLTDFLTSRMTSKLWFIDLLEPLESKALAYPTFEFARVYPRKRYWFFVTIGFDQLIHYTTLALTLKYLGS
jgi:hypothetical protein